MKAPMIVALLISFVGTAQAVEDLTEGFLDPPDSARPGVYWFFMDGNLDRQGMTDDLEAMKAAGIGNLVWMEVNVGVPRGSVDFLSEPWQELFVHAVREAERLGIEITVVSGPGWTGSGGPWVRPEQSMQRLVASSIRVAGGRRFDAVLPRAPPRKPYFENAVSGDLAEQREEFYEDVAVLAFPTPQGNERIAEIDEKALYYRAPYTSRPGVKPYLPAPADYPDVSGDTVIDRRRILDLSGRLDPDGRFAWDVPDGDWTIMRFGRRNNGATTRPAPQPGLGFECDKFDASALDAHLDAYIAKLLTRVGQRQQDCGWTMLHIDSWEMGAQNWTPRFRAEFRRRRGYDLLPMLPAYTGWIVGSVERTERFLWDLRLTAQELVLENHARHLRDFGAQHGLGLSIEPYDMNPTSDLDLGAVASVPMCEFWSEGLGFDSSFSCFEATSIAHTLGRPVVAAEAFTADSREAWQRYPAVMKNQGDWAFCTGINRFVYHTFAHKPLGRRPGMTMGPYGVHWDRSQTWWPMIAAYHQYIARCQYLLRQGQSVADICYLAPEGAPHVFRPPASALTGDGVCRDRRGYNFDGCSPNTLLAGAGVRDGCLVLPSGAKYRLLVLPAMETMTPQLLGKIRQLVEAGATVVGPAPRKSPSLVDYPRCDQQVASMADVLWGPARKSTERLDRQVGQGRIVWGGDLHVDAVPRVTARTVTDAQWIWSAEDGDGLTASPGTRYFRRRFTVDPGQRLRAAQLEITADNSFQAFVNGHRAGRGSNFHNISTIDIRHHLKPGVNTVAVAATNGGTSPNPAGLLAAVHLVYDDDSEVVIPTDQRWEATPSVDERSDWWDANTLPWSRAKALGPAAMSPWQPDLSPSVVFRDLYPDYDATASLLNEMNVPADFTADGPVRYTHRQGPAWDIYLVANRTANVIEADCTFRVAQGEPELWDPLTGDMRALPVYSRKEERTTVPMRFEAHQSFFVVFQHQPGARHVGSTGGRNFLVFRPHSQLDGSWNVSFDPRLAGPERVVFDRLLDWSQHDAPGIKYYSGIATYRKNFSLPKAVLRNQDRLLLDLGTVHNMARVRLNGKQAGVVWCAPWQVDLTNIARAGDNQLEIEVANLWPNRLIGDKRLPADQQITWTTYNPYQADSPLLPSGLLGPVRLGIKR